MSEHNAVSLPDVLGAISGGERLNVDVIQCAVALRPSRVPAGHVLEAVLLAQNASDVPVDMTVAVRLPAKDAGQNANRFILNKLRSVVALRPAEVGYVSVPISVSPKTTPAKDYRIKFEVSVKRVKGRRPSQMRPAKGGGAFNETELPQDKQDEIWKLQQLVFQAKRAGRNTLSAKFAVRPVTHKPSPVTELAPQWHTLWTLNEHNDVSSLFSKVSREIEEIRPFLKHEYLFFPLLETLQERFQNANYPLKAGESVFMAKALTLVAEQGLPDSQGVNLDVANWVQELGRILLEHPKMAKSPRHLLTNLLFEALLHDTVTSGLTIVEAASGQDFGSEQERDEYADDLLARLKDGTMDTTHAYLPLVLAGLVANTRVTMPHENPRESIKLLLKAQEFRRNEIDPQANAVMEMLSNLLSKTLDRT